MSTLRPRTRRLISKMPCSGGSANVARRDWRPIFASSTSAWPRWLPPKTCEGRIDFAAGTGVEDLDLQPHRAGGRLHIFQRGLRICGIGRIDENSHMSRSGHKLTQEFQPLCRQLPAEEIDTCQVTTRPGEA